MVAMHGGMSTAPHLPIHYTLRCTTGRGDCPGWLHWPWLHGSRTSEPGHHCQLLPDGRGYSAGCPLQVGVWRHDLHHHLHPRHWISTRRGGQLTAGLLPGAHLRHLGGDPRVLPRLCVHLSKERNRECEMHGVFGFAGLMLTLEAAAADCPSSHRRSSKS